MVFSLVDTCIICQIILQCKHENTLQPFRKGSKLNKLLAKIGLALAFAATAGHAAAQAEEVINARVLDIKKTTVTTNAEHDTRTLGSVAGGAAGAYLSREAGWAGQIASAGLGWLAGDKLAKEIGKTKKSQLNFIVKIEQGPTVSVIQDETEASSKIEVGDMVYLTGSGPDTRIVKHD